jgi:hypothetical protein
MCETGHDRCQIRSNLLFSHREILTALLKTPKNYNEMSLLKLSCFSMCAVQLILSVTLHEQ